jgi:hypothetical protein
MTPEIRSGLYHPLYTAHAHNLKGASGFGGKAQGMRSILQASF